MSDRRISPLSRILKVKGLNPQITTGLPAPCTPDSEALPI